MDDGIRGLVITAAILFALYSSLVLPEISRGLARRKK
jgi:hypothetical protein